MRCCTCNDYFPIDIKPPPIHINKSQFKKQRKTIRIDYVLCLNGIRSHSSIILTLTVLHERYNVPFVRSIEFVLKFIPDSFDIFGRKSKGKVKSKHPITCIRLKE